MSIKQNILYSLNQSRRMMDGLVDSLATQEDWMYQAHPKANHPLWIVGHLKASIPDNSPSPIAAWDINHCSTPVLKRRRNSHTSTAAA